MMEQEGIVTAQEEIRCGNGDNDEENEQLLSTICRLEVENLRLRRVINNYGFNLKERVSALELERRELVKAMEVLKPEEDPSCYLLHEDTRHVSIDFSLKEKTSARENEEQAECTNQRPFTMKAVHLDSNGSVSQKVESALNGAKSSNDQIGAVDDARTRQRSGSRGNSSQGMNGKMRKLSGRSKLMPSKATSQKWNSQTGEIEEGDAWNDIRVSDASSNGGQVDDSVLLNKRQSAEIAFNSMRLSVQNPIIENNFQQNFLEFYMVGVERSILTGEKKLEMSRHQPSEILNRFPMENAMFVDSIADFAFPTGAFLQLTQSEAYAKLILHRRPPQYHVLQFSDSQGTPTYACCLTVTNTLRLRDSNAHHRAAVSVLSPLMTRTNARLVLIRFFRMVLRKSIGRRQVVLNKAGEVVGYISPTRARRLRSISPQKSTPQRRSPFRQLKRSFVNRLNPSSNSNTPNGLNGESDITEERRREELSPRHGFARTISLSKDNRDADSEEISESSDDEFLASPDQSPPKERVSPKGKKRGKGKKATKAVNGDGNGDKDHFLVSQRAYVLLSARPLHGFLFKVLEVLSKREELEFGHALRALSSDDDDEQVEHKSADEMPLLVADSCLASRNRFLKFVQYHPLGDASPNIAFKFPSYLKNSFVVNVESVSMEEWADAILFTFLSPSLVLYLLNALLLEKSIILFGSNTSLVTAMATAVLRLVRPYSWEGAFIPLIPSNALEVLEAPVPFIVGTNIPFDMNKLSPSTAIVYLDQVLKRVFAKTTGRVSGNDGADGDMMMTATKSLCLRRCEMPSKMPVNHHLRAGLETLHRLLTRRLPPSFRRPASTDHNKERRMLPTEVESVQLSWFLKSDVLSPDIRRAIRDLRESICRHNASLAGDITAVDGGWREYGAYDPSSDSFTFFPQFFLDHQRSMLEFQTAVASTQLFHSHVLRVKVSCTEQDFCRRFVADFLSYQYRRRKLKVKQ